MTTREAQEIKKQETLVRFGIISYKTRLRVCNYELEKTVYLFVTLGNTTNLKKRKKKGREKNT